MTQGAKILRLSKVAKEFNIGTNTIIEFLSKKGFSVENNPNSKIPADAYDLLFKEFQSEKTLKEATAKAGLNLLKRDTVSIDATKAAEEDSKKAAAKKQEFEEEELFIKDMKATTPTAPEPVKEKAEEKPAPPAKEETPAEKEQPQAESKAPSDEKEKEGEEQKEKAREEKETVQPAEKETKAEGPESHGEGVKVVGKMDLEEKKPARDKKDEKATPAGEDQAGKKEKDQAVPETGTKEDAEKEPPASVEKPSQAAPAEPEAEEVKPEKKEEKDPVFKTQFKKLEGPTILGKMELPQAKEPAKKPVASSSDTGKTKRRKRKRIKKEKPAEGQTPGTDKGAQDATKGRRGPAGRKDHVKPELTEEEISRQIRETLASLSGTGKSKASKHRRLKRDVQQQQREREMEQAASETKTIQVAEFVSAAELANLLDVSVNEVISTCMSLGLFVSINQRLDAETISIVADEFGAQVEFISAENQETIEEEDDDPAELRDRAPIVTVMGHVDHGKTSLLDRVRHSNIIAGEAGGITQHIGAYNVVLDNGKSITFLDTPGHEAFTAMRARGAKVTDVAIIVVAADDNVMPQTVEAINHAQAAGVPIVIAINKIDKPGANPERVKEELSKLNILVEDWGGKYQSQEISAKDGVNIDSLLEKVLLEAELKELKANPFKRGSGTVIESSLDKGRGYLATVLVQNGTMKVGDIVVAGTTHGKVKAMFNERGQKIKEAGPSSPVLILGLDSAPLAGDIFHVMDTESEAKSITTKRQQLMREQGLRTQKHITLDEIGRRIAIGDFKELNIIVKGDVDGSIEALSDSLLKLSTEEVQVNIIHKAVGSITEGDVLLASASNAIIIGFQVRPSVAARKLAENEQIDIRLYSIIYNAISEIKSAIEGMLSPEIEEKITANLEVRDVFKITKVGTVAGCMVLDGKIHRNADVRLIRDGIVVYTGRLGSLKRFKDDVKEVSSGYECGLNIDRFNDIKVGDIIEAFETIEIARKLD
ncbi:MAG: translation initiation factor IF-2 [Bacteroidales bacterium]